MFGLKDSWVWDFWLADDGERYHLFFLVASKALHDPDARHLRASIGHAVSTDLTTWDRVEDALVRSEPPAFDDVATWTGSTIQHPDGTWFMFYTGVTRTDLGVEQTIGYATSRDLTSWTKNAGNPALRPDGPAYETLSEVHDVAFRDPWVFPDPDGNGWHMLITARGRSGSADNRGIVGHAWSPDLRAWELRAPLSEPGQGFPFLEVLQVQNINGRTHLLFSCPADETAKASPTESTTGGVWTATGTTVLGPFNIAGARQIVTDGRYSGRIVQDRETSDWLFLAFDRDITSNTFCQISDPQPIWW